jgi:hypothetical protein
MNWQVSLMVSHAKLLWLALKNILHKINDKLNRIVMLASLKGSHTTIHLKEAMQQHNLSSVQFVCRTVPTVGAIITRLTFSQELSPLLCSRESSKSSTCALEKEASRVVAFHLVLDSRKLLLDILSVKFSRELVKSQVRHIQ